MVVTGWVRWFDPIRGLGLLSRDSGGDLLMHASAVPRGTVLVKGTRVEFDVADHDPRGPMAVAVTVLEYPAPGSGRPRTRWSP